MRDSCGTSGTGETPQAFTPRMLTARPAESEHLEGKSTTPHYLVNSNKVCENSLFLKHGNLFINKGPWTQCITLLALAWQGKKGISPFHLHIDRYIIHP
jgi:hypothetical protein